MFRLLGRSAILALAFFALAAHGEAVKLGLLISRNVGNLNKLSVGMMKDNVIKTMGTDNAKTKNGLVPNPWETETITGKDGGKYEVMYYITRHNPPFTPIGKFLATPVVLKGGKVVGWGSDALEKVKPKPSK